MSGLFKLWRTAVAPARATAQGTCMFPMPPEPDGVRQNRRLRHADPTRPTRIHHAGLARSESDSGLFSSQSLTRMRAVDGSALCLWMDSACGCADSANHIT